MRSSRYFCLRTDVYIYTNGVGDVRISSIKVTNRAAFIFSYGTKHSTVNPNRSTAGLYGDNRQRNGIGTMMMLMVMTQNEEQYVPRNFKGHAKKSS